MNKKISLDFDFLDESPKSTEREQATKPVATTPVSSSVSKVNLLEYLKECYSDFNGFCKNYLVSKKPPYLLLLVWLFGIGSAADNLTGSLQDYTSWGKIWAIVILSGIFTGALGYYIGGWFYNVRVGWSKGKQDINMSRNINLFTSLPISLTSILMLLLNQMTYGEDYLNYYYSDASTVDVVFFFVFVAAIIYTIRLSYMAVRETMHVEKKRAIGWFIVAPAILYTLIIFFSALE
jgi:hypothetical protein